jgi:sugar phosphate isomerase/epimerase
LFTGQWADLPFSKMVQLTKEFGYDGIELACWGDHFEVQKANSDFRLLLRLMISEHPSLVLKAGELIIRLGKAGNLRHS